MTTNLKAIGRRIAALRDAAGMTQVAAADAIGVSRSTLAGIEAGGDRGGIVSMIAIADLYKVPMDWLLHRAVPPGGPLAGKFVDDPDELALLRFWEGLDFAERTALLRLLRLDSRDVA